MTKHAVIRTDLMAGTEDYGQLKSVKFYKSSSPAAIDNGNLVVIDSLLAGEREIYKAVAPTSTSKPSHLYITAGVVLFYDQSVAHYEDEWENAADTAIRAYKLHDGDVFGVTVDAFTSEPEVGNFVEFTAENTKMTGNSSASATSFGKVIAKESAGRYTYWVVAVMDVATAG